MRSVNIVPTQCPKFLTACLTCGIELEEGTPGVSNVYSKGRKYDPDEPGDVHYYLSDKQGVNPLAVAKVWANPDKDLQEAAGLEQRILKCSTPDEWKKLADDIETLILTGAVAMMSRFASGKIGIDNDIIADEEEHAWKALDAIPARMRAIEGHQKRPRGQVAADLTKYWKPAMNGWLKTWIHNYKAHRGAWMSARQSIKIERENNPFPLIIPKGKDTAKLLRRWA